MVKNDGNPVITYEVEPPTIEQFVNGEEYLKTIFDKHLFPFWMETLKGIYPNRIDTEYPVVILKGGYGTGKSTVVRIMAEYNKCRILSLSDPNKVLGVTPGDSIKFKYLNSLSILAEECFSDVIDEWEETSPFFNKVKESGKEKFIEQITGGMDIEELGDPETALFYSFSEMDFSKDKNACERILGEANKWKSKFGSISKYFGGFVIDATSSECDCVVEKIQEIFGDKVLVINTNQWVIREHSGLYGKKGWFKVYTGDGVNPPFIVDDSHPITDEMNSEKVIEVPEELRLNFKFNLDNSIRDIVGVNPY